MKQGRQYAHRGQQTRTKGKKKKPAEKNRQKPKTILDQYRRLLEHHPEVINGLMLL